MVSSINNPRTFFATAKPALAPIAVPDFPSTQTLLHLPPSLPPVVVTPQPTVYNGPTIDMLYKAIGYGRQQV